MVETAAGRAGGERTHSSKARSRRRNHETLGEREDNAGGSVAGSMKCGGRSTQRNRRAWEKLERES